MIIFGTFSRSYRNIMQDLTDRGEWHEEFNEFIEVPGQHDHPLCFFGVATKPSSFFCS